MNRQMERARARYKEVELPAELDFAVASAIRAGDRKRRSRDGCLLYTSDAADE